MSQGCGSRNKIWLLLLSHIEIMSIFSFCNWLRFVSPHLLTSFFSCLRSFYKRKQIIIIFSFLFSKALNKCMQKMNMNPTRQRNKDSICFYRVSDVGFLRTMKTGLESSWARRAISAQHQPTSEQRFWRLYHWTGSRAPPPQKRMEEPRALD